MYQSKIINLSFVSVALFAATVVNCLNPTKIEAKTFPEAFNQQLSLSEINSTNRDLEQRHNRQDVLAIPANNLEQNEVNLFLSDNIHLAAKNSAEDESKARLIRLLSLSFFLLFFVPLGIFYPLFLFYKMLLVKPDVSDIADDSEHIFSSDRKITFSESSNSESVSPLNLGQETATKLHKATVSKLQIAFLPPASELRKELSRVTSVTDLNGEDDLVDLMHKTVEVLIDQGHWTHISYNSTTLPLEQVKPEFDFISYTERNKFNSKKPSLVNYNRNVSSKDGYARNYSYVVVTLILCTSHSAPLFKTINTKKQLAKELAALGNMEKDSVIKFELLWNPQQEDTYISNDQLLVEYGEMIRLL